MSFRPRRNDSRSVSSKDVKSSSIKESSTSSDTQPIPSSRTNSTKKGGEEVIVNIDELESLIEYLRKHQHVKVSQLTDELHVKYQKLISHVTILSGTKGYSTLTKLIEKHFGNISKYQPATIGAYFGGCLAKTSFSDTQPGCSPICAGSMPIGDNPHRCTNIVIVAPFENGKYNFIQRSDGTTADGKKTAYIFIEATTMNLFQGFSEAEKNHLKARGIENVILYCYRDNGKEYFELTGQIKLDECKSRLSAVPRTRIPVSNDSFVFWVIFIIIIIIIAIAYLSRRTGYNRRPYYQLR